MKRPERFLIALAVYFGCVCGAALAAESAPSSPTHKQLRTIKPRHGDHDLTLLNFVLDKQGDLWISVADTPRYAVPVPVAQDSGKPKDSFVGIQVYDPEGKLKAEYPLEFSATAMSLAPDGTLFVSGQGKMARLSPAGEVQAQASTPNIGDVEEFKAKVVEQAKAQQKQFAEQYEKQVEAFAQQVEQLEKKKEDERTPVENARLEMFKRQKKSMESVVENMTNQKIDPESTMLNNLAIPGLAATAEHVFVTVRSLNGRGYEVWRTNHELADAKMVRDGLSGCCGNMDIQPREDGFVACENTKFEVVSYNPEGERLASFGKRDRTAPDGFGSCCNPMNCLSLAGGDYVVAESSIGNIKKFSADGKFLGIVGKARISGGCKHVSLGFDEQRDRYYMMNQDKNHVCVLVPLSEAPAVTEEERQAQDAKAGLGKKLAGHWRPEKASTKVDKQPKPNALQRLLVRNRNGSTDVEAEFLADGSAKLSGGSFAGLAEASMTWECVSQADDVLTLSLLLDGVEFQTLRVKFLDDDHMQVEDSPYFPAGKTYLRVGSEPASDSAAAK